MTAENLRARATEADRRITGERWCSYGRHYVRAQAIVRTSPRPQCTTCAARIASRAGVQQAGTATTAPASRRRPITPALPPVLGERYRDVLTDRARAVRDEED